MLANISHTGAFVEDAAMRPEIGTRIMLYVYLKRPGGFEDATPLELAGVVVRHGSDGFAVKFEDKSDPDVRRMVNDIISVATIRR